MDKDDFKAIAVSIIIAPFAVFAFWWLINFTACAAGGYAAPMWYDFNTWVVGLFH